MWNTRSYVSNKIGELMRQSELRLVRRCAEFRPQVEINKLPPGMRGLYVLYKYRPHIDRYDVVYVGMARQGSIRGRLKAHRRKKVGLWTHFSIFQVWDNIRDEEVSELEGLFRHIYRKDTRANRLNVQRSFKKVKKICENDLQLWKEPALHPGRKLRRTTS
jgi:hypothetical protein